MSDRGDADRHGRHRDVWARRNGWGDRRRGGCGHRPGTDRAHGRRGGEGAQPVILTGTRDKRLDMGMRLGADEVINVGREDPVDAVHRLTGGRGVQYVLECSGAPNALNEAARMVNRGGRICLAAFPGEPVPVDLAYLVRNNIYVFGIRGEGKSATHRAAALMAQKRFDAKLIHTHTFPLAEVPTAIRYARDRVEDAIKVVVRMRDS